MCVKRAKPRPSWVRELIDEDVPGHDIGCETRPMRVQQAKATRSAATPADPGEGVHNPRFTCGAVARAESGGSCSSLYWRVSQGEATIGEAGGLTFLPWVQARLRGFLPLQLWLP